MSNDGIESPLEFDFWHHVQKTKGGERDSQRQAEIQPFRVDSLFKCDGKLVVVELDGAEFHQDRARDFKRDMELLKVVDSVIHIPYAAMHFYPRATFCVLAKWFNRFELRAVDRFCMPISELEKEIALSVSDSGDFPTRRAFLEWAEPTFELWGEFMGVGWVGSPKAWLNRWDVKPITNSTRQCFNNGVADWAARKQVYGSVQPPGETEK